MGFFIIEFQSSKIIPINIIYNSILIKINKYIKNIFLIIYNKVNSANKLHK